MSIVQSLPACDSRLVGVFSTRASKAVTAAKYASSSGAGTLLESERQVRLVKGGVPRLILALAESFDRITRSRDTDFKLIASHTHKVFKMRNYNDCVKPSVTEDGPPERNAAPSHLRSDFGANDARGETASERGFFSKR